MTALDTNILVRFVTQDDDPATPLITKRIEQGGQFFLANVVLAELVWVLRGSYDWSRAEVFQTLETLILTEEVSMESPHLVEKATKAYQQGGDWADHFIVACAEERSCSELLTLDKKIINAYPQFAQLP